MWSESEIYGAIARGWCDERNSGKEMDVDLADAIAIEVLAVVRSRIATLEAQVEQAREALEKIEAKAPIGQYEPDAEYWEWGNYDDAYAYGLDTATMRCAQIATAALQALREGGDHAE